MDDHGHEPQLPAVMPQPVPTSFNLSQVVDNRNGNILAQVAISTPTGTHIVYVDPETAKSLGEALLKIGNMSGTGLLMP
jgi:hypothetical protein